VGLEEAEAGGGAMEAKGRRRGRKMMESHGRNKVTKNIMCAPLEK
jgi:hypothetical protein